MRIRVFISSVQKELADERMALQVLLTTDSFLAEHCVPVLFEEAPAPLRPDAQAYLKLLGDCQVYLGIIWKEYGNVTGGLSATHHEYKMAQDLNLPTLIMVKGGNTLKRKPETKAFFDEIRDHGHTYDRFKDTEDLQTKVRDRLIKHIKDTYDSEPSADQQQSAQQTIHVASPFERQRLDVLPWSEVNKKIAQAIANAAENKKVTKDQVRHALRQRGYLWRDDAGEYFATASGILLFALDPTTIFTHARIQLAAYPDKKRNANPQDHATVQKPISTAIDEVVDFINKNTRHPLRVVGLNRIELNEYPDEALREALVNALAHRDYEDASRKITVDVFKDRIEIISPGGLAGNLTLAKLRGGNARSRSRNPGIAQGLVLLERMEERGTGIQRMTDHMLDHGLDKPKWSIEDDELIVTLFGPGDDLNRIQTPKDASTGLTPSVESKLNDRQKAILAEIIESGRVNSSWVQDTFNITRETASKDLKELMELDLLESQGKARGTHYVLKP